MRTYYFDIKGGVTTRDRDGLQFLTAAAAIEHSKRLAGGFAMTLGSRLPTLFISVIDEFGSEIHQEQVYKSLAISQLETQRSCKPQIIR